VSALVLSALVAGLAGSLHCAAMCSAFAGGATLAARAGGAQVVHPLGSLRRRIALVHAGRLASYALLGGLAGLAGQPALAVEGLAAQRLVGTLANLMLLALAVSVITGRPLGALLERAGFAGYRALAPRLRSLVGRPTPGGRMAFGALWGLTPCALVYAVLPVAMFAGSAPGGAGVMLAFGLGTLPSLALIGALAGRLAQALAQPRVRLGAGALIATLALAGLYRALLSAQPLAGGAFCFAG
jgi:sulfite exporter TauE/SafE